MLVLIQSSSAAGKHNPASAGVIVAGEVGKNGCSFVGYIQGSIRIQFHHQRHKSVVRHVEVGIQRPVRGTGLQRSQIRGGTVAGGEGKVAEQNAIDTDRHSNHVRDSLLKPTVVAVKNNTESGGGAFFAGQRKTTPGESGIPFSGKVHAESVCWSIVTSANTDITGKRESRHHRTRIQVVKHNSAVPSVDRIRNGEVAGICDAAGSPPC